MKAAGLTRRALVEHRSHCVRRATFCVSFYLLRSVWALEPEPEPTAKPSLADLSIESLLDVKVTTVSKKEEKLSDAAAAVFVLNNDDIRRSGVTNFPDALRLVPGVQVASLTASDYAISSRGFNSLFANKLLVMIDGRSVYSPFFAGVNWDTQQVFLEDVERIEVIRGPGATIWGANAVNGVISVISQSARDTQGGLLYGAGGSPHLTTDGGRYGGRIGADTYYRIYGSYQQDDNFKLTDGRSAEDAWAIGHAGFRLDHYVGSEAQLTWQGDGYAGSILDGKGEVSGFNTLGRWTHSVSSTSSYSVQSYVDYLARDDFFAESSLTTVDVSFQHNFELGRNNNIIWGLGYRYTDARIDTANNPAITILRPNFEAHLFSAFIQDEFAIVPDRLTITLGTKLEHNDFTGFEVQPSARLLWKPTPNQSVWASVSRAVRTPSETEDSSISFALAAPFPGPGGVFFLPTLLGNKDLESEEVWAYELGYRAKPSRSTSIDLAAFYNQYHGVVADRAAGVTPGFPITTINFMPVNGHTGESYGGELLFTVSPTSSWRVSAGYSLLFVDMRGEPRLESQVFEANAPTHQGVLRSSYDITNQLSVDGQLRYVDNVAGVPAYVTGDVRISYRPKPYLELSVTGQNLLDASHPEQRSQIGLPTVEVPRGVYGKITWHF